MVERLAAWPSPRSSAATKVSGGCLPRSEDNTVRCLCTVGVLTLTTLVSACGNSPTSPSTSSELPFVTETATMRYYYEAGDSIDIARQEAFNAWAIQRLGITLPQKVEYRKYVSREAMGRYTGNANTNGFAEPSLWRFHTISPYDNHESVHVYTALFGRPSDFFNEGIAVSFQTNPASGDFTVRFNGQPVHDACRTYLQLNTLPLPVSRYVTTTDFRGISDQTLSYRMAGSFVLHMTERFGLPAVIRFFQTNNRDESLDAIRGRVQAVFGVSLDDIESSWLARLRSAP
jgi:hypothetical protein